MENREAIELIKRVRSGDTCPPGWETLEAFDMAISALEKQEEDRWIPVTERLPEKEGCYLVTVKNDHERRYSKTAWYSGDGWFARQDIIAWRLTPEPYTEEEA
jgi:hypothetical protein